MKIIQQKSKNCEPIINESFDHDNPILNKTTKSFLLELFQQLFHSFFSHLLFNSDSSRDYLVYMFSYRFSGSKFLIYLRRQFRVRKIFRAQGFARFTIFSFCA